MQFPASRLLNPPSSNSPTARSSTSRGPPKLRDSCHTCASSKVKCNKEKPTCFRCKKRGLTCEYVVSKRAGRKHDSQSTINDTSNISPSTPSTIDVAYLPPQSNWFALNSTNTSAEFFPSSHGIQTSPRPTTTGPSYDLIPNTLSPMDHSLSSILPTPNTDPDDFFTSPVPFSLPEAPDTDVLGQMDFSSTGVNNSSNGSTTLPNDFDMLKQAVSKLPSVPQLRSPLNSRASPSSDAPSKQCLPATDSPCCCLIRALDLLSQLCPNPSASCTASTMQDINMTLKLPTIQTVIMKNEQTVNAVSTMLQCPCSQDGYLLSTMFLIVLKVLGWYAAVARKTPLVSEEDHSNSSNDSLQSSRRHSGCPSHSEQVQTLQGPVIIGGFYLDGEDSARMAAQLVLSELHRVQRLVNQLSIRLQAQAVKNGGGGVPDTPSSLGCESTDGVQTHCPFSAMTLDQLGADLRRRLKGLSLEIMEGLRKECGE